MLSRKTNRELNFELIVYVLVVVVIVILVALNRRLRMSEDEAERCLYSILWRMRSTYHKKKQ